MGGLHQQTKTTLRRSLSERRAAFSPERVADASSRICALVQAGAFERVRHVVLYAARPGEIDPVALATAAAIRDLPTYYPRVEAGELTFRAARPPDLCAGRYGIHEPGPNARLLPVDVEGVLIVVPGLAFDRKGARLGTGLGYYDRALPHHPMARRIGLVAHDLVVDVLPTDEWDVPMHAVATERGLFTADGCVGIQPGDHS
jgi:5-formyltetrahydrofolate cyclo-ligase